MKNSKRLEPERRGYLTRQTHETKTPARHACPRYLFPAKDALFPPTMAGILSEFSTCTGASLTSASLTLTPAAFGGTVGFHLVVDLSSCSIHLCPAG